MMISTRGRYALRILIDLAEHQENGYVTLREIAGRQEISEKYLESIVKDMVKAGILEGVRGKGGGYRFCCAPEEINVLDVLSAAEGSLAPVACLAEGNDPCPRASVCPTLPFWEGLDKAVSDYISGFTVKDLMKQTCEAASGQS